MPGVRITGEIVRTASTDTYGVHNEQLFIGGYRSVADSIARDALDVTMRVDGMLVTTLDTGVTYQLQADLTTWAAYTPGAAGSPVIQLTGDVTGNSASPIATTLANSGVVAGTKGTAARSITATVDAKGRVTSFTDNAIAIPESAVTGLVADLLLKEDKANKGIANGYVPLNGANMIDPAYYVSSGLLPKGNWNVVTNTPAVADGTGALGWWYIVTNSANPTARNLGSGAINFFDGDWVIHDGAKYVRNGNGTPSTVGISTIVTDSGSLTGASVNLNSTAQIAPTANRQYQTALQKAIQDAAVTAGASAANRYALLSEVTVTGNPLWTPESYAGNLGYTLGNGTSQTFASYGKSLGQAQADFPYVPITATSDLVDWAALYQTIMMMGDTNRQNALYLGCFGARDYRINKSLAIPKSLAKSSPCRYEIIGNGCLIRTTSTTDSLINSLPASQTEAMNTTVNTLVRISGLTLSATAAATKGNGQAGIRIGGRDVILKDVLFSNFDTCLDLQFCLGAYIEKCSATGYQTTGFHFGPGTWTGASINNAAANATVLMGCRANVIPGQNYGYHFEGGSDTTMYSCTAEGSMGASPLSAAPQNAVFYDTLNATAARGTFQIYGLYLEQFFLDSAVRIKAREGAYAIHDMSNQNQGLDPTLCRNIIKLESYSGFVYFELHRYAHWTPSLQFYLGGSNCLPMFYSPWSATAANLDVPTRWSNYRPTLTQLQASVYLP